MSEKKAPKILNLDTFKIEKKIILNGRERTVRAMTVKQFLQASDFDEAYKEAVEAKDSARQINLLVDLLLSYIEGTTREELIGLEVSQLSVLMNYVRGMEVPTTDEGSTEGNGVEKSS